MNFVSADKKLMAKITDFENHLMHFFEDKNAQFPLQTCSFE